MKKTYYEIFEEVDAAPKEQKVAILHKYSNAQFKEFLDIIFNPGVKWVLPEGKPPVKDPEGDHGSLAYAFQAPHNFKKLYYFLAHGPYPNLDKRKRESVFIDFLGSVHPKDADLVIAIKDKKWPYKTITAKLIKEAFPKFTSKWVTTPSAKK